MLAQKYDRHMFQGTTYRDLGDWYLDHETGRDQIDLSGVKPETNFDVKRKNGQTENGNTENRKNGNTVKQKNNLIF